MIHNSHNAQVDTQTTTIHTITVTLPEVVTKVIGYEDEVMFVIAGPGGEIRKRLNYSEAY